MTRTVQTIREDAPIEEVFAVMERAQIRRVLVVDGEGCLVGIIAQADLVATAPPRKTAELLTQISREPASPT